MEGKKSIQLPISLKERLVAFGELESIEAVASGGMATVFRVRQPQLNRSVAVKSLKPHLAESPETRERFRREAKALASVLHQNVAHVYGFYESEKDAFIVMEYIEGIDLSQAIQKVGALPARVACSIFLGICRGVGYIHNHHLIHRDIKPSNIRLTPKGEVKLMDFGIVMDTEKSSLTRPGMMVGSPSYLSPEQVVGDPLSYQSDIFLLGICFYEMLTGTRPFNDDGNRTVFQKIRDCDFIPADEMNKSIPRRLNKIIEKCLEKDPRDRYSSVSEMIQELESLMGADSSRTQDVLLKYFDDESLLVPQIAYSDKPVRNQWGGFKHWGAPVLAAGLLLLGLVLGYWAGQTSGSTSNVLPPSAKPLR
ncbi:serine/threonine protein kinase [bacterium]|nr:serine/threonine protein kinase [bacterium]